MLKSRNNVRYPSTNLKNVRPDMCFSLKKFKLSVIKTLLGPIMKIKLGLFSAMTIGSLMNMLYQWVLFWKANFCSQAGFLYCFYIY